MLIFESIKEWISFRKSIDHTKYIGFVPTMGCLHEGHASLIRKSVAENDFTVLSIFLNKTQFPDQSDFENYPITTDEDLEIAKKEKVDAVILPTTSEMYHDDYRYKVTEDNLSMLREGSHRLGHFTGVLTVVMKLLNIVKAQNAYFGEKDYQQYELVKGMKEAFFIDTEIIPCPTERDENGIALSSRNRRLTREQMNLVKNFPLLLSSKHLSPNEITEKLKALGFKVNYIEDTNNRRYGSVQIGDINLIDNFNLS